MYTFELLPLEDCLLFILSGGTLCVDEASLVELREDLLQELLDLGIAEFVALVPEFLVRKV